VIGIAAGDEALRVQACRRLGRPGRHIARRRGLTSAKCHHCRHGGEQAGRADGNWPERIVGVVSFRRLNTGRRIGAIGLVHQSLDRESGIGGAMLSPRPYSSTVLGAALCARASFPVLGFQHEKWAVEPARSGLPDSSAIFSAARRSQAGTSTAMPEV
jgi:hypothetical protein